ncbi:YdcF family protein [Prochlorococcus sp. MIT 0603]|uniref:YdcF family protein n=1 Tax=unclassified Prochlorococcus TaxID=2627481 RepID=UPI0005336FC9|nr:hypothetical protein EV06_2057 [Prochlorococcus sp. MIT 0602]
MPLGISLLFILVRLRRRADWSIQLAFLILWTSSLGIIADLLWLWVEHPWQRINEKDAPTADIIVVLSGGGAFTPPGISTANTVEWIDPDRFLAGIKLFKEGKASKLLFTGAYNPFQIVPFSESNLYVNEALRLGIPENSILTTNRVTNTAQEAIAIRRIITTRQSSKPPKILLVTSAFHMKRAKKLFERQGLMIHPFPVDFKTKETLRLSQWKDPMNWVPTAGSLFNTSKALRELLGRVVYRSW